MSDATPPLMTQAEAAERLHVSTRTIREYIATKRLPAYRIAGTRSVRIEAADVEALIKRIPVVEQSA